MGSKMSRARVGSQPTASAFTPTFRGDNAPACAQTDHDESCPHQHRPVNDLKVPAAQEITSHLVELPFHDQSTTSDDTPMTPPQDANDLPEATGSTQVSGAPQDNLPEPPQASRVTDQPDAVTTVASDPPMPGPPPAPGPVERILRCQICCETFRKDQASKSLIYACSICEEPWCTTCVKESFVKACSDRTRMPVKCCGTLSLQAARSCLTKEEVADYQAKHEEWSTPSPFYCPVPTCSAFIPLRVLRKADNGDKGKRRVDSVHETSPMSAVDCPKCTARICTNCRQLAHPGSECNASNSTSDDEIITLLIKWGYRRCPKCRTAVRKMWGCTHMGCICGAHWCWNCQRAEDVCGGGCVAGDQSDTDMDTDGEEETENESADAQAKRNPGSVNVTVDRAAIAAEVTVDHITTGGPSSEGAGQTHGQDTQATIPERPREARRRNLDAGSHSHWETSSLDFGDDPQNNIRDNSWGCSHEFYQFWLPYRDALGGSRADKFMECHRCWSTIHPTIPHVIRLGKYNTTTLVMRKLRRGRRFHRQRRVYVQRQALSHTRMETQDEDALETQSLYSDSSPEPMEDIIVSDNCYRTVDTYGNVLASNDFILNPPPRRRASFEFSFRAEPTISFDPRTPQSLVEGLKARDRGQSTEQDPREDDFSLAHMCSVCDILVCETCKGELETRQREREAREREWEPIERALEDIPSREEFSRLVRNHGFPRHEGLIRCQV